MAEERFRSDSGVIEKAQRGPDQETEGLNLWGSGSRKLYLEAEKAGPPKDVDTNSENRFYELKSSELRDTLRATLDPRREGVCPGEATLFFSDSRPESDEHHLLLRGSKY